jgi:uncharacterized protein (TIGR03435 family)
MVRLLVLILFAGIAWPQTGTPLPSFEVADVQISKPGAEPDANFLPGGKLLIVSLSMKELIQAAWDMDRWPDRFAGGPDWLDSVHYDIVAKAVPTSSEKDLRLMLRQLLIDRFRLQTHVEKRPLPVYALVPGKKVKLEEAPAGEGNRDSCKLTRPGERKDGSLLRIYACTRTGMDFLAAQLSTIASAYFDVPVVNLTGLKGLYNFTLGWTPRRGGRAPGGAAEAGKPTDLATTSDPDGVTIFDAVESQLGLKLEQRKYPLDVIVIDKVQREPIEQ